MNLKACGGKLQHKAYCEKHSMAERAKVKLQFVFIDITLKFVASFASMYFQVETQRHGIEDIKSLKPVRVRILAALLVLPYDGMLFHGQLWSSVSFSFFSKTGAG